MTRTEIEDTQCLELRCSCCTWSSLHYRSLWGSSITDLLELLITADQPSAGLSHLRPGRGVRPTGSVNDLRIRPRALHGDEAQRAGQKPGPPGQNSHDAVHPLYALCALCSGGCWCASCLLTAIRLLLPRTVSLASSV